MRIENLTKLSDANAALISIAQKKQDKMLRLRNWLNGFDDVDPPTQAQLDAKIVQLAMTDLQDAFNAEKAIFIDPDVIPDTEL